MLETKDGITEGLAGDGIVNPDISDALSFGAASESF